MADLAKMRAQVYKDPRPAEHFDRFHERSRTREPDVIYDVVRLLTTLFCLIVFRARCRDAYRVPTSGPVILAPNHFSFMDHFLVGMFLRRKVRFMAKSQLFKRPMQFIYSHGGVFPVRRGHDDEEVFITARSIFERGGCVVMYLEGGRSRTGELGERPKRGIGRLALETGVPVIPVAILGSNRARNWKRLQVPKVTVQFGEPIPFERLEDPGHEQQQEAAERVFAELKTLYVELARHGRRGPRPEVAP